MRLNESWFVCGGDSFINQRLRIAYAYDERKEPKNDTFHILNRSFHFK